MFTDDLKMKHVYIKFISCLLTQEQESIIWNVRHNLSEQVHNNLHFLCKVSTEDESSATVRTQK